MDSVGLPLVQLASISPLFLVWVVGIVFSALRLRESRIYWLVLIAMVLFLVAAVGGALGEAGLITAFQRAAGSSVRLAFALGVLSLVRVVLEVAGWALVLVALFRRRSVTAPVDSPRTPGD